MDIIKEKKWKIKKVVSDKCNFRVIFFDTFKKI